MLIQNLNQDNIEFLKKNLKFYKLAVRLISVESTDLFYQILLDIKEGKFGNNSIQNLMISEFMINKTSQNYHDIFKFLKEELSHEQISNCLAIFKGLTKKIKHTIHELTLDNWESSVSEINSGEDPFHKYLSIQNVDSDQTLENFIQNLSKPIQCFYIRNIFNVEDLEGLPNLKMSDELLQCFRDIFFRCDL